MLARPLTRPRWLTVSPFCRGSFGRPPPSSSTAGSRQFAASPGTAAPTSRVPAEQAIREDLAAAYRLCEHYGWGPDLIYNHISARLPDKPGAADGSPGSPSNPTFLINPYGDEVLPTRTHTRPRQTEASAGLRRDGDLPPLPSLPLSFEQGLGYDEVTASSLITVDSNGAVVDPGSATGIVRHGNNTPA
jgi:hypothetical protein